MDVKVMRAGVEHVDAVAPLFDRYRQFYKQPSDLLGARQFLRDRLTKQQSAVFLAVDEAATPAAAVGFVQLYPCFSSASMCPIWILNDLFVVEGSRRRGVARLLMDAALDLARSTGCARIRLSTGKGNMSAKSLYMGVGYRLDDEFDHLYFVVS